jgi:hypothetical protein
MTSPAPPSSSLPTTTASSPGPSSSSTAGKPGSVEPHFEPPDGVRRGPARERRDSGLRAALCRAEVPVSQCRHYNPTVGTRDDDPRVQGCDEFLFFTRPRSGEHCPDDLDAAISRLRAYLSACLDHHFMCGLACQTRCMRIIEGTKHDRVDPRHFYDLVHRLKCFR